MLLFNWSQLVLSVTMDFFRVGSNVYRVRISCDFLAWCSGLAKYHTFDISQTLDPDLGNHLALSLCVLS